MKNTTHTETFLVWPAGVPGGISQGRTEQETIFPPLHIPTPTRLIRNVVEPTLQAYLPDPSRANGTAVVVCPGGCFSFLSIEVEGEEVARWLNERGVAAFVLKYRLAPTPERDEDFMAQFMHIVHDVAGMQAQAPVGISDGQQALKLVRQRASEWGVDPERIGVLGFSAGGAIALAAATQYTAESRPAFAAPIYGPVWQELKVPQDAPPLFIALADDDPSIADGNMPLYNAWKASGHPVELHIYAKGGHGFGMTKQGLPSDRWIEQFADWLVSQGFLE
ncbi:alpha/beta hydrolase [Ktedonosporobacter rubrisoli]|nr:alpha/beta hydrolase [Ktedonosporobacter rubrisoli]